MTGTDPAPLLEAREIVKHYPILGGVLMRQTGSVKAVDGVSLTIGEGETVGLVGESGCGKTTFGRTILRLEEPTAGEILFRGRSILGHSRNEMQALRREMQIIFQDPFSSLNPRKTVGQIVGEPLLVHGVKSRRERDQRVLELLEVVGLRKEHMRRYPHQFSGGQRQRIGVARALALKPKLVVCDEAVSALDVSIQAQIINLLRDLQEEFGIGYLFVAHDLAVVRQISHRVAVMYLGHIVEQAPRTIVYTAPLHPYTHSLLSAVPIPDPERQRKRKRILLEGDLPSPINPPSGCVFRTRCFAAQVRCAIETPPLVEVAPGHKVACHFPVTTVPESVTARA